MSALPRKLCEADLDAVEADRLPMPSACVITQLHAERAPIEPIQSLEAEHPWMLLLYAAAAVAACAASALFPGPWF